jgi:Tfp pilus assembly protein PilF
VSLHIRSTCFVVGGAWAVAALLLLQGCVSSSPRVERRDAPDSAEQADPARRAEVHMELAAAYFGRGQGSTALDEIKQVIAARPNFADAYNLRGLVQASMGDAPAAGESSGELSPGGHRELISRPGTTVRPVRNSV